MTTVAEEAEVQEAREKEAVASMRHAKANMELSLARIATLERGLSSAIEAIKYAKTMISPNAYTYAGTNSEPIHARLDRHIEDARKAL